MTYSADTLFSGLSLVVSAGSVGFTAWGMRYVRAARSDSMQSADEARRMRLIEEKREHDRLGPGDQRSLEWQVNPHPQLSSRKTFLASVTLPRTYLAQVTGHIGESAVQLESQILMVGGKPYEFNLGNFEFEGSMPRIEALVFRLRIPGWTGSGEQVVCDCPRGSGPDHWTWECHIVPPPGTSQSVIESWKRKISR